MSRGSTPRRAQTAGDLGLAVQFNAETPWHFAQLGSSTDARAALAPQLSGGTRVRHWQSARRLWPDMRRLQLPLDDCCRLVPPHHARQHATDGTDP